MFTVRNCYRDKAERFVRMYGQTNFAAGGSALDVPYVWKRYGAVPEEVYSGLQYGEDKHVHGRTRCRACRLPERNRKETQ